MLMYAIVCSEETDRRWSKALTELRDKYQRKWPGMVERILYSGDKGVEESLKTLRKARPAYTCFVAHHTECTADFVNKVHRLVRQIDPANPFGDTVWGILTGLVMEDVLFAVRQEDLVVRRALGGSSMGLSNFESGVSYSEWSPGSYQYKRTGEVTLDGKCSLDTTKLIVDALSEPRDVARETGVDFIFTSGHASQNDWEIGYSYESGSLVCGNDGNMVGQDLQRRIHPVRHNGRPKVYSAAGNCFMGLVDKPCCMALSWMHSVGVVQMTGYVCSTWFGYMGWGVHNYFFQPGLYSFAEAFFANNQALLLCYQEEVLEHQQQANTTSAKGRAHHDGCQLKGLQFDRDSVAFYGDPAFDARLLAKPDLCDFSFVASEMSTDEKELGLGWKKMEIQLVIKRKSKFDRPPIYILPRCAKDYRLLEGNAIVTCRFVLFHVMGLVAPSQQHKAVIAMTF